MNNRDQIFIPLLKEFTKLNLKAIKESNYPWAPFIPYAFSEYRYEHPRVFYIGIDTYYWGTTTEDLIMAYEVNDYSMLFHKNDNVVTPKRIFNEWYTNKGPFWEFICKMQLFLRDQKLRITSDLRNLSPLEERYISEIGYGNANLIELPKTLDKEGNWETIDENMYWQISESAKTIFSPIKNILDSYKPEIIFVLGGDIEDAYLFKGLNYKHLKNADEGKWRKLYYIQDYNVRIVKTYHPRAFCTQGSNNDEMVEYLYDSLKLFSFNDNTRII